jgi:DNA modification methylase
MPLACGHPPKYGPGGPPTHRNRDGKRKTRRKRDGTLEVQAYKNPEIANPGNIIDCGAVGGGKMGSRIAHENEAPFPEKIPNFFIRSFCPPDGLVMDAFCGSGTTGGECAKLGRNFIGIDLRKSQIDLTYRRIQEAKTKAGFLL